MGCLPSPEAERLKEVKGKQSKGLVIRPIGLRKQGDLVRDEQDSSLIAQESEIPECTRDLVMAHRTACRRFEDWSLL